jgi:uncharacterized protein YcbK (DUF882 family)
MAMPTSMTVPARRQLLRQTSRWALAGAAWPLLALPVRAASADARSLQLDHTHTGEKISLVYASAGQYLPQALQQLNHFLRDHYTGEVGTIDPGLLDLLHAVQVSLGAPQPFQVISGYRCPQTNDRLRSTRGGGVAKRSLHMDGKAIDVRIPGVPLTDLRDAALTLKTGGVGTYMRDQFVHVDTGRVRSW